jgi:hypothetical protein
MNKIIYKVSRVRQYFLKVLGNFFNGTWQSGVEELVLSKNDVCQQNFPCYNYILYHYLYLLYLSILGT